jgi:ATP-dependent helicase HrpB
LHLKDYEHLPVSEKIPEIKNALSHENTVILTAPPGAGKSTLVPLVLMDELWLGGKKILILEPRRLAARMIAYRMSDMLKQTVGETVGYRIKMDTKVSSKTRIEVVTEGILTRMLQSDNSLADVGLVIFDEFHERSIHADTALAFCRETQQIIRPDLRILIMSATIDAGELSNLLNAKFIEAKGRQYPVEIIYSGETDPFLLPETVARITVKAVSQNPGDVLIFLPGEPEIKKCEEIIVKNLKNFAIHPLYSKLPKNRQNAAVFPDKSGKRKIVLATSIAETSLTIEGIKIVIDTGFGRTSKFDPSSGLSRLETVQISRDSADQRAGRAGRLSPGLCYRMWTKTSHFRRASHRIPEILETDLASLALEMIAWGVKDTAELTWVTPPPPGNLAGAYELLIQLGAIENGKITRHGKLIHSLPCHPRIAHMLILAKDENLLPLATDIAALLEERDPLASRENGIDINHRIEALRRFRRDNAGALQFRQIEKLAGYYRKIFKTNISNDMVNVYETGLLIAFAYPERIACARPGNNAQFQLSNGRLAMAHHSDDLAHEPWLAVAQLDARDGIGKIHLASPLNPRDLAPLIKSRQVIKWETKAGGMVAATELSIGNILLKQKPLQNPDEELMLSAVVKAIRSEGLSLLSFNADVNQLQYRILSLRKWFHEENWPDFSTEHLIATPEKWLLPWLINIRKNEDLENLNLKEILKSCLSPTQLEKFENLAPEKIVVPGGSSIKLKYYPDGSPPILSVRLQEVFGMMDTPKVAAGKISVLMHLLSPGFKVVQVTSDLKSFWAGAYFEIKKEMKRRYPKHAWPDNPLSATPTRTAAKKKL